MKTINEYQKRFYNLLESKSGDVKPLIVEQETSQVNFDESYFQNNPKGTLTTTDVYGNISKINGIELTYNEQKIRFRSFWKGGDGFGRGYTPGEYNYEYKMEYTMGNPEGEMVIDTKSINGDNTAMYFMVGN
jgi:hypothetical protein